MQETYRRAISDGSMDRDQEVAGWEPVPMTEQLRAPKGTQIIRSRALGTQGAPELASPGQLRLEAFLNNVEAAGAPLVASVNDRLAAELIVGLPPVAPLTTSGRDLDNYLYPHARRLGPARIAAMLGRKVQRAVLFLVCLAQPAAAAASP